MKKIKIALVDDELTSRNMMKRLLENNLLYEVAADFQSGKTALEWLRKNRIDILLCDMQMPEMNGVELMRNVHIIDEYLPVVAISGFDDFNYVRGSLINGAANYLLKHELSREKLLNVLEQVREKYRIIPEGRKVSHKRGYCIYDEEEFTAEHIRGMVQEGSIDFECSNLTAIAIGPDYRLMGDINFSEYKNDISKAILDMLNQMLGENYKYLVYVTKAHHLLLLLSFADVRSTLLMLNTMSNLVSRLQRQVMRMLDITVTIVSGDIHKDLQQVIKEAIKLEGILKDKFYLGGNRIVSATVTKKLVYSDAELPGTMWNQLEYELANNLTGCTDALHDIFEFMEKERYVSENVYRNSLKIIHMMKEKEIMDDRESADIEVRMGEYEEYEQYRSAILDVFSTKIQLMQNTRKKEYSPQIVQVIEFLNQNYAKEISLKECAERIGSSYTHLSREFKKETGMRFVEFLNRQRVNKAKSLLIRENMPMKKIVELSGFRNYTYFFKVFKEIEGITPSEFVAKK